MWKKFIFSMMVLLVINTIKAETLYIIGNSLTSHFKASKIGWNHAHGMAATSEDKDYAHLLLKKLEDESGKKYNLIIKRPIDEAKMTDIPKENPEHADIVLLQIGENSKVSPEMFAKNYEAMVIKLKELYPKAIIVLVGAWKNNRSSIIASVAAKQGVLHANIEPLSRNIRNSASSDGIFEHNAIKWHPGDAGMQAIADVIWKQIELNLNME